MKMVGRVGNKNLRHNLQYFRCSGKDEHPTTESNSIILGPDPVHLSYLEDI